MASHRQAEAYTFYFGRMAPNSPSRIPGAGKRPEKAGEYLHRRSLPRGQLSGARAAVGPALNRGREGG